MTEQYAINVRVDDEFAERTPTCRLRDAIARTLDQFEVEPGIGVTLLVTDDRAVQKLNQRFRAVDAPTDVLSFPAGEAIADEEPYLGDIVVAFPYTAVHAEADGFPLEDVLVLLAVHGSLHLLGFDHDTIDNQVEMWAVQRETMGQLGASLDVVPPLYDFPVEDDPS